MEAAQHRLVSRTRCSVQRCCAEPGPRRPRILLQLGPRLCSAPPTSAALRPGHENTMVAAAASTSSLRA